MRGGSEEEPWTVRAQMPASDLPVLIKGENHWALVQQHSWD